MTVVKIQGNCFLCASIFFEKKKKKNIFYKYINIKIEMNLCSGKTAKLKDLFPIERDCGLNAQLLNLNFLTSFKA